MLGIEEVGVETTNMKIFATPTYKDALKRIPQSELRSIGGKSSSPKKVISIINTETDEIQSFDSKSECMKFLGISSRTFSKFVKGLKVRGCKWEITKHTL